MRSNHVLHKPGMVSTCAQTENYEILNSYSVRFYIFFTTTARHTGRSTPPLDAPSCNHMGQSNSVLRIMARFPKSKTPLNSSASSDDFQTRTHGFKWLDGRGFKESGSPVYMLPGDELEYVRLNKQHYILRYGRSFFLFGMIHAMHIIAGNPDLWSC